MSKKTAAPAKNETDSPSMEDILNSIRGVVEGDEDAAELEADADLPEEEDETDEEDEDILLLDTPAFEEDDLEKASEAPNPEPAVEKEAEEETPSADDLLESLFDDAEEETAEKIETAETENEDIPEDESEDEQEEPEITSDLIADLTAKAQEETGEPTTTQRLISDTAAEESTVALKHLMESIPKQKPASPTLRADMTLEELVVESIRPHLAMWLNENLPDIVKQLVQKEIRKLLPDED